MKTSRLTFSILATFAILVGILSMASSASAQLPTALTQDQINSLSDQKLKIYYQWLLEYQNQNTAVARQLEANSEIANARPRGPTQADFPNLPGTAADCAAGRHWELVPLARCVCDGDLTHKPVSNDQPAACVGIPPPPPPVPVGPVVTVTTENQTQPCPAPMSGTMWQSRQVITTDGVPAYGAWAAAGDTCAGPSAPPASDPVITTGTENQTLACVGGQTGAGVHQTRQVTYTNGAPTAYGPWITVGVDCNSLPSPPITPPADPMVPVAQWICGILYASAVVPQSQVAHWYAIMGPAAQAWYGWDGSCGVGL